MGSKVKILVLPVYRKYVLYHAWQEAAPASASITETLDRAKAQNLEERVQVFSNRLSSKVHSLLLRQWENLRDSKPRTLKNYLYRLAQGVLSREDPEESFLKAVPKSLDGIEVIYPATMKEREVRRRIRLLLATQKAKLRSRILTYGFISVPLVPLMLTPVPNIPLYYCGYKAYSASQASAGCSALKTSWDQWDTQQLQALREKLLELQEQSGVLFPAASWPAKLIAPAPAYKQTLDNAHARVELFYRGRGGEALLPKFSPSQRLSELCRPEDRLKEPITDVETVRIAQALQLPDLLEHVARARKAHAGAMFPREYK